MAKKVSNKIRKGELFTCFDEVYKYRDSVNTTLASALHSCAILGLKFPKYGTQPASQVGGDTGYCK